MEPLASVDDVRARAGEPFDEELAKVYLDEASALFRWEARNDFTDTVPDIVRYRVAAIVARTLQISPDARAGVSQTSTTTGPVTDSATYAGWAIGGQLMLSPDDRALARSFWPRGAKLRVVVP